MHFDETIVTSLLRAVILLGALLAAGSVLYAATDRQTAISTRPQLRTQILFGVCVVLVATPVSLFVFQLAMSGGDTSLAFGPDMRWLAFQMPQGQAAILRLLGIILIAANGLRLLPLGLTGAILTIGSFTLEGHTAAAAHSYPWLPVVLVIHLLALAWWFAGLLPLANALRNFPADDAANAVHRFARIAVPAFGLLVIAGVAMFLALTGARIDAANRYQLLLLAKTGLFAVILGFAAYNKFVLTPGLRTSPANGQQKLPVSIRFEIILAVIVLIVTGFLTSTSPGHET